MQESSEGPTARRLEECQGAGTEDALDVLATSALATPTDPALAPALLDGFGRAGSTLTKRSVGLALALHARRDDTAVIDALFSAYAGARTDPFMASAFLEILGLFSLRSPLVRYRLCVELLSPAVRNSRYLAIKASKVVGWLYDAASDPGLLELIEQLSEDDDLAVRAEALYQRALLSVVDMLRAPTRAGLQERLIAVRAAFARAQESEEHRPDAAVFVLLLDMLLQFGLIDAPSAAAIDQLAQLNARLRHLLVAKRTHDWHGYVSDAETLLNLRVLAVADALVRAAKLIGKAEDWTNIDWAFIELAGAYALINAPSPKSTYHIQLDTALREVAPTIMAPTLGAPLTWAVGRRRLALVTERYIRTHGEDDISIALCALLQGVGEAPPPLAAIVETRIASLARLADESVIEAATGLFAALENGTIQQWSATHGLPGATLPIDKPDLYGGDPTVDFAVRSVLEQVRDRLDGYPRQQWYRFVEAATSMITFIHNVRDDLPPYMRCKEDGGLGQAASERHLQDDLFITLRREFGRGAVYERRRVAGGRSDTGLEFPECSFPVEVKAEYTSVARAHVHGSYISQSDLYATARDRLGFLVILDLRASNADGHRSRRHSAARAGHREDPVSLYTLRDGLWVDTLPADTEIVDPQAKAVIVALVPGNRPLPSSTTHYSRRP